MKIAVIGAGLAGTVLADKLAADKRFSITVFEKSRGMGGRMSTRYSRDSANNHEYDHGAQFFTARSDAFKLFVSMHQKQGHIAQWQPKIVTLSKGGKPYSRMWFEAHYVATPRMSSLCKIIMADQTVHRGIHIRSITKTDSGYVINDQNEQSYGSFDWIISTAPAEQTANVFFNKETANSKQSLLQVEFEPCFALMVPWQAPTPTWHAAKVKNSKIEWLCFNHLKPGRQGPASLLVHSTGTWAHDHFNDNLDDVKNLLGKELNELIRIQDTTNISIHRWRYARTTSPLATAFWQDETLKLAACGDWCLGSTVEDAYTSAAALADHLLASL